MRKRQGVLIVHACSVITAARGTRIGIRGAVRLRVYLSAKVEVRMYHVKRAARGHQRAEVLALGRFRKVAVIHESKAEVVRLVNLRIGEAAYAGCTAVAIAILSRGQGSGVGYGEALHHHADVHAADRAVTVRYIIARIPLRRRHLFRRLNNQLVIARYQAAEVVLSRILARGCSRYRRIGYIIACARGAVGAGPDQIHRHIVYGGLARALLAVEVVVFPDQIAQLAQGQFVVFYLAEGNISRLAVRCQAAKRTQTKANARIARLKHRIRRHVEAQLCVRQTAKRHRSAAAGKAARAQLFARIEEVPVAVPVYPRLQHGGRARVVHCIHFHAGFIARYHGRNKLHAVFIIAARGTGAKGYQACTSVIAPAHQARHGINLAVQFHIHTAA